MSPESAQFQYVTGQMRESFGPLFAAFEERNTQALALGGWQLDVPYGPHAREVFDLRQAPEARGTVVYFHAGYWQSRDRTQFRFLAPAFNALGWDMALVNYPLCPEVSVAQIVESAATALHKVQAHQASQGRSGPLVVCGHSAGAHLAVEMALRHAGTPVVAGAIAISGVYDLRPLRETTLNDKLKLDAAQAQACSPALRARAAAAPALFILGQTETAAFHTQSQDMARQWQQQGNTADCVAVPGTDHFSVLEGLGDPNGQVAQALRSWCGLDRHTK